ncbi:MAG: sulfatase-like hydrolase/transferase, partial [Verrucomicrobiales bacterium]|nr:sulfatase-like hydrolase/transferase [Verrucomicrobiales bacterium]
LTGRYAYQAGQESLHYASTTAEMLGAAGYHTMMVGKWHLSQQPTDFGFSRYFGHLSGACNYYRGDKTFRLNGEPFQVPESGFYTTVANVDYAMRFLNEARQQQGGKPWYLHVAFNAPHAPLQPLKEDYEKYLGRYSAGWDVIHAARAARQKELGLVSESVQAAPRPDHLPAWSDLPPDRQKWEERRMTALAGMIDRVDQEVGRLVEDLRKHGELDRTLILFVSDNGACPYDRTSQHMELEPYQPETSWSDSTGWSWVRNTPFRLYKQNQHEGGIRTPGIVHWPEGLKTPPGAIVSDPVHLVDVLPTLAALTGAEIPEEWPERELRPIAGISFDAVLKGKPLGPRPPLYFLFGSDRGLRKGPWKLVSFRSGPWELYDMLEDPTELNDLAGEHPEIRDALIAEWTALSKEMDHAPAKSWEPVATTLEPGMDRHPEWTDFTQPLGPVGKHATHSGKGKRRAKDDSVRARRGTDLEKRRGEWILTCTGDDPGLAFDRLRGIEQPGPYRLSFRIKSQATGEGDVFWTTDAETKLPDGTRRTFPVEHDGEWHEVTVEIPSEQPLQGLRLDPCGGSGQVTLTDLRLLDAAGNELISWIKPAQRQ